jgi:glycosyltransferase involved in cell wall biosynthesis
VADRPLRIAIDGRELVGQPTGVGRYLYEVLREWSGDPEVRHTFDVILPSAPPLRLIALGPRFRWRVEAAESAGTWWEQTRLARAAAEAEADVFFAAGYTAPWRLPCPLVVAVYDVSYFAHPEWFGRREGWRRRWLTRSAGRRAQAIVTISEFSADEIVRWLGVPRERLRLAPPGAPAADPGPPDGPREPMVLYVGSLFNRRRIPDLIDAFALTARDVPSARLVLVGDNRTSPRIDPRALAAAHGVSDRMDWREYVTDEELVALYRRARVFAFLSDYEGFGMTPLEAAAYHVPSVLLDTPVSREVHGDAARLVPLDRQAISDALTALLTDDAAHSALTASATRRLSAFSWTRSAATILAALEQAGRT